MFFNNQTISEQERYIRLLKLVGSLSGMFSESEIPYLYYRVAEIVFCKAFGATDHSRSDIAVDASKEGVGIGLKTFLHGNGKTLQKIAEFNQLKAQFQGKSPEEIVHSVASARNTRIQFAQTAYNLNQNIYHSVTRSKEGFSIFETNMPPVDINAIADVINKDGQIRFNDGIEEYSFNLSKSTLFKRFNLDTISPQCFFEIQTLSDPLDTLEVILGKEESQITQHLPSIYLPLYSERNGEVQEKSALNQWNSGGRSRSADEAYIPIPAWIHRAFVGFFPPRDTIFELVLPNKKILSAKVCQDNSKALMSNPNGDLGKWLLRDVFHLKEGELATRELLDTVGCDSVYIKKISALKFEIDFAKTGAYATFASENKPG